MRTVSTDGASADRSSNVVGRIDAVDEKRLYRRIDWHIMPLMFFCYLLQFLDKVLINYANIVSTERHPKPAMTTNTHPRWE
jgi:hypothetical protein